MIVNKDRLVRIGQLSVAVLAGLLTVMAVVSLASRAKGQREITALLERYDAEKPGEKAEPPEAKDKKKSPQEEQADRIAKRDIFSVDKPKEFSLKLMGVLGELVYFQGENNGFAVGQSCKEAKIKQIGPDWVVLEFDGKDKKLYVFGEDKGGAPPAAPGPGAGPVAEGAGRGPRPPGAGMPADFKPPPEMIERLKSMPEQMRQRMLERMPAEMREKIEKEL